MPAKRILVIPLILISLALQAQIYDPVTWKFGYEKKGEGNYELIITAFIEKGSHIYSMDTPEGGPIPTSITINASENFKTDGEAYEATVPQEVFDEAFGLTIKSHSNKAEFRKRIISSSASFTVDGIVSYMACNNVTCSPPKEIDFSIRIGEGGSISASVSPDITSSKPMRKGLFSFFLISMLAGFAGILTPCVFPMIPMTVAFFSQGSDTRTKSFLKAGIFGLSIILIYSSLGIIVSLTSAGAGFASALSTHWIPNIIFFALFLIFAVSFFGAFDIVLPSKWATGLDNRVDRGGMLAAFFMGLTTVIVSFSCTGPIVGALLVEAVSGDVLKPTIGMFGFGLAFALPFTLFAIFPSILGKMSKSGGWLNSVKVVLGFIMLAFSMKFLSTIDSVYNLGLISRDLFLSVWIVIFTLMGLYLMGKIKLAHDSGPDHIGVFRLFIIIAVFTFVVYMIPGLFGAPLKGLSAFLPSHRSSWFSNKEKVPANTASSIPFFQELKISSQCFEPKYADKFEMPFGLTGYFDYEQGLACAKEQNKPALLDFKGHACANCKLMEAKVWSDPEVLRRLRDNFVIISLYVDDRTQLPENEWIVSEIDGKQKKTIGKQNEDLEITKFRTNSLPLYVITDFEGNPLNEPMITNLNIGEYKNWLDEGYRNFSEASYGE